VALLDDLGAAPPKKMYLEAVFQGGLDVPVMDAGVRLSQDYLYSTNGLPITGGTALPPIPEPSTGLLLSLGLIGLAAAGPGARERRERRRKAAQRPNPR